MRYCACVVSRRIRMIAAVAGIAAGAHPQSRRARRTSRTEKAAHPLAPQRAGSSLQSGEVSIQTRELGSHVRCVVAVCCVCACVV